MKRIIYAEDVKQQIDEWLDCVGDVVIGKHLSYYGELLGCIEDSPTVEAVPIAYGKWETVPNKVVEHGEVITRGSAERCSNCFHASPDYKKYMMYCPNCGAKMKKEENKDE